MGDTRTGSCMCGKVQYIVPRDMKTAAKCHCQMCQKSTGTSNFTTAVYGIDALKITGDLKSYTYTSDAGNSVTHHFCPNCGSKIFITNPTAFPRLALVFAGSLDASHDLVPQFVVFNRRRPAWDGDNPDIPHFPGMPPS